eukprot:TRINITY_DN10554_c0_g1_i2.p1 TRINITY_DN10554_c0_g1~~TRINITY_DN10554_c0_g1_i2.p1  ORF type:complete len:516 (-),score=46.89 TRINITY_DN10554_c0_g1_i2:321-1868(-)
MAERKRHSFVEHNFKSSDSDSDNHGSRSYPMDKFKGINGSVEYGDDLFFGNLEDSFVSRITNGGFCRALHIHTLVDLVQRFFGWLVYERGYQMTTIQVHFWAFWIGVIGGVFVFIYGHILKVLINLLWNIIPKWLYYEVGMFSDSFPVWNYMWMLTTTAGLIAGLLIVWVKRFPWMKNTGTMPDTLEKLHKRGYIGGNHVLPMFVISLVTITTGGSAGPEAAVLVMMGAIASKIGRLLGQLTTTVRVLTLCGMSAGISAFFGIPIGGALFVLEVPHYYGLQYYEAVTPCMLASIISIVTVRAMDQSELGGEFMFPEVPELRVDALVKGFIFGLIGSTIAVIWGVLLKKLKKVHHSVAKTNYGVVISCVLGGVSVGVIGMFYPETLFWSENEIQHVLSAGDHPLPNVPEWFGSTLKTIGYDKVPYDTLMFFQVALAKLVVLATSVAAGFPGGVIFPLFYAGGAFGYGMCLIVDITPTLGILCMMGAVEVAITRTPWATCLFCCSCKEDFLKVLLIL